MAKAPPHQVGCIATCVQPSIFAAKALRETRLLPSLKKTHAPLVSSARDQGQANRAASEKQNPAQCLELPALNDASHRCEHHAPSARDPALGSVKGAVSALCHHRQITGLCMTTPH